MEQAELLRVIIKEKGVLKIVLALKDGEFETAELLRRIGGYLNQDLKKAHKEGYIERVQVDQEGVGHFKLVNRLTGKGEALLKLYERYSS